MAHSVQCSSQGVSEIASMRLPEFRKASTTAAGSSSLDNCRDPTSSSNMNVSESGAVAQAAPPGTLSDIRGLELHLDGTSESIAATKLTAETAPFTTAVFFKNRND